MTLKIGDKFKQNFPGNTGLIFEIIKLDLENDTGTVEVTTNEGHNWSEDWDDMHTVVWALELGEYKMI